MECGFREMPRAVGARPCVMGVGVSWSAVSWRCLDRVRFPGDASQQNAACTVAAIVWSAASSISPKRGGGGSPESPGLRYRTARAYAGLQQQGVGTNDCSAVPYTELLPPGRRPEPPFLCQTGLTIHRGCQGHEPWADQYHVAGRDQFLIEFIGPRWAAEASAETCLSIVWSAVSWRCLHGVRFPGDASNSRSAACSDTAEDRLGALVGSLPLARQQ